MCNFSKALNSSQHGKQKKAFFVFLNFQDGRRRLNNKVYFQEVSPGHFENILKKFPTPVVVLNIG